MELSMNKLFSQAVWYVKFAGKIYMIAMGRKFFQWYFTSKLGILEADQAEQFYPGFIFWLILHLTDKFYTSLISLLCRKS